MLSCLRYVNEIAAIVHSNVSSMDGSPNKNIGDAFLLVWRLPAPHFMDADDLFQMNEHQPRLMRPQLQQVKRRAALAAAAAAAAEANEQQQQQLRRRRRRQRSPHSDDDEHSDPSIDADVALSDDDNLVPPPAGVLVEQAMELEEEAKEAHESLLDRAKKAGASIPPVLRTLNPNVRQQVSVLADKALVSFLRIIVEIHASDEVKKYANHPRIKEAFHDFEVQLGFGLHCGWAIEGPIGRSEHTCGTKTNASLKTGSEVQQHLPVRHELVAHARSVHCTALLLFPLCSRYKIDASYLSPHVNLSELLQDATKIYGTPLLVSGEFYSLLSPYLKCYCRRIDVVKVGGREAPINLYTFDMHPHALAAVVAEQIPIGYDADNEAIAVVELKGKNAILADPSLSSVLHSDPLSPGSGSAGGSGQFVHELFRNPYLNAHVSDFDEFEFDAEQRRLMQERGPIASYHLVRNYRLSALQCGIPHEFFDAYSSALDLYLSGDWPAAHRAFLDAQRLYPEDVATRVVLDVMREQQFVAPPEWAGWHEV